MSPISAVIGEDKRAQQLAAAKKKLKSYRATRTSGNTSSSHSRSPSGSSSKHLGSESTRSHEPSRQVTPVHSRSSSMSAPLGDSTAGNMLASPSRSSFKGKEKAMDLPPSSHRHRKSHSRSNHSRSGSMATSSKLKRASVIGAFDMPPIPPSTLGESSSSPNFNALAIPHEIITTPATPLPDKYDNDPFSNLYSPQGQPSPTARITTPDEEDDTRSRLSTFSFGSKLPPVGVPVSPSRGDRRRPSPSSPWNTSRNTRLENRQPLLPSQALRTNDSGLPQTSILSTSPLSSPSASVSAPSGLSRLGSTSTPSRPPSLFLTKATPLHFSPSRKNSLASEVAETPITPPLTRTKRHSHTRSSSISLPNLKLAGARPNSLGIQSQSSPSFPTSPASSASPLTSPSTIPTGPRPNITVGTRLKFEPSGRGAEAEMQKEESRRKALEKLTGNSTKQSTWHQEDSEEPPITPGTEISLPDLDDDVSSTASSVRPLSGLWGSHSNSNSSGNGWSRPDSLILSSSATPSPTPFWATEDPIISPSSSVERWSSGSGSGNGFGFSFGSTKEDGLGFGMDLNTVKRGSLTGGLSVLAEVDEAEEDADDEDAGIDSADTKSRKTPTPPLVEDMPESKSVVSESPVLQSSPVITSSASKLRELHLLSQSTRSNESPSTAQGNWQLEPARNGNTSPTKGYGAIGRGRPKPITTTSTTSIPSSSPMTASISTPNSINIHTPRSNNSSGTGPRRKSSISYKKDTSSMSSNSQTSASSRDWSFSSKLGSPSSQILSPPQLFSNTLGGMGSPSSTSTSGFTGWGHIPRQNPTSSGNTNRPCPRPKSLVGPGLQTKGANRVLGNVEEEENLSQEWPSEVNFHFDNDPGSAVPMAVGVSHIPGESLSINFRDHTLELEMERDALREDVEGWKRRCRSLEESYEKERKEVGMLQERVRKLSDRLSAVSSAQPSSSTAQYDERSMIEMRNQFFQLTASVERERREKESALEQVELLQSMLLQAGFRTSDFELSPATTPLASKFPNSSSKTWGFPKTQSSPSPTKRPGLGAIQPSQPQSNTPPNQRSQHTDPNLHRMNSWRLPSAPIVVNKSPSKRESFFGLSSILQKRNSKDDPACTGIDLPPIAFPSLPSHSQSQLQGQGQGWNDRSVSDPIISKRSGEDQSRNRYSGDDGEEEFTPRTVSLTSSASSATSSAISFLSEYLNLNRNKSAPGGSRTDTSITGGYRDETVKVGGCRGLDRGMDLRNGCNCCTGEVIEI